MRVRVALGIGRKGLNASVLITQYFDPQNGGSDWICTSGVFRKGAGFTDRCLRCSTTRSQKVNRLLFFYTMTKHDKILKLRGGANNPENFGLATKEANR